MEDRVPSRKWNRQQWMGRMLSILRIVVAVLYIEHGTNKVFNVPFAGRPVPHYVVASLNGVAGILETCGGTLMLVGLLTRPVAFLLAGEMAVAYFKVHLPRSIFPIRNGGDNVVLFCFVYLYLVLAGGGPWSIDAILARAGRTAPTNVSEAHDDPSVSPV
jgi:putative oxidoreductase